MSIDAILKIGGSLSRGSGLEALSREVSRLSKNYFLLVVPGGGKFADQVREACRRYRLDDTAGHCMALLAMDQYGYLLHQLINGSVLVADLASVDEATALGRTAVLLPSASVFKEDPLPHSWQVTSDSIAASIADRVDCGRLILLKDVDGLFEDKHSDDLSGRMIVELAWDRLAMHAGGVDEYFCRFYPSAHLETWIVNGLHPERLAELLNTGRTTGTRITPPDASSKQLLRNQKISHRAHRGHGYKKGDPC